MKGKGTSTCTSKLLIKIIIINNKKGRKVKKMRLKEAHPFKINNYKKEIRLTLLFPDTA